MFWSPIQEDNKKAKALRVLTYAAVVVWFRCLWDLIGPFPTSQFVQIFSWLLITGVALGLSLNWWVGKWIRGGVNGRAGRNINAQLQQLESRSFTEGQPSNNGPHPGTQNDTPGILRILNDAHGCSFTPRLQVFLSSFVASMKFAVPFAYVCAARGGSTLTVDTIRMTVVVSVTLIAAFVYLFSFGWPWTVSIARRYRGYAEQRYEIGIFLAQFQTECENRIRVFLGVLFILAAVNRLGPLFSLLADTAM